jgi:apolipoprotein N-acyltransferase
MHNSQSRLRAIETGRDIVRSANTGISSVIDPLGNVKEKLGALESGYVVSTVHLRRNVTPYTFIGNAFVYLCMVFSAALLSVGFYQKLRNDKFINNY